MFATGPADGPETELALSQPIQASGCKIKGSWWPWAKWNRNMEYMRPGPQIWTVYLSTHTLPPPPQRASASPLPTSDTVYSNVSFLPFTPSLRVRMNPM